MQKANHAKTKSGLRRLAYMLLAVAAVATAAGLLVVREIHHTEPTALIGGQTFYLEVADNDSERIQGLSGHALLAQNEAMLFVFEESGEHCFWMKDMNFAIDIIWLDKQKEVIKVAESTEPDTYPTSFCPDRPASYVIETRAGIGEAVGLEVGEQVQLRF